MNPNLQGDALNKLIRLATTIVNDQNLLSEMIQEIKNGSKGAMCGMFRALFKRKLLGDLASFTEIMNFFMRGSNITDFCLHSSPKLGIRCFFMPKNTSFPLHSHTNDLVCTGVLFGQIKYVTLNRISEDKYLLSRKSTAKMSDLLFCTKEFRNIHSILALEDSVIVDIFMPNTEETEDFSWFKVHKKREREFTLEQFTVRPHCRSVASEV